MPVGQAEAERRGSDASRSALDFVHGLLRGGPADGPGLDGLLGRLADAFAASGAGFALLTSGKVLARRPAGEGLAWADDADLAARLLRAPAALAVTGRDGGRVLVTAVHAAGRPPRLLWLEAPATRPAWTDAEAAALALAGQALARIADAPDERPRWAEGLERAEAQKDLETAAAVAARVAHDYGNVLTGVIGFCDLSLALKLPADSHLCRYLRELQRCAQNGAQLTQMLRLFARRQAGGVQPCDPAALIAEEAARVAAAGGGFSCRADVPGGLPPVAVDGAQLRQVLAALLENARDAMQGAGAATVSARPVRLTADDCLDLFGDAQPGPFVEIAVSDSGPGLDADARRRLFREPFFTSRPRRRGFGLAVAYGILHAHHGGLRLRPGDAGGTTAAVYLPCAGPAAPPPAVSSAANPARGERILVVDDDPMILRFICTTLEHAGYRARGAADAEEALTAYAADGADRFRLVLTDILMPGVTGPDLARRLLSRDPAVRVLFMSGESTRDVARLDFSAQGFDFLSKPFRPEGLLRAVRGAIDRAAPSTARRPEGAGAARASGSV